MQSGVPHMGHSRHLKSGWLCSRVLPPPSVCVSVSVVLVVFCCCVFCFVCLHPPTPLSRSLTSQLCENSIAVAVALSGSGPLGGGWCLFCPRPAADVCQLASVCCIRVVRPEWPLLERLLWDGFHSCVCLVTARVVQLLCLCTVYCVVLVLLGCHCVRVALVAPCRSQGGCLVTSPHCRHCRPHTPRTSKCPHPPTTTLVVTSVGTQHRRVVAPGLIASGGAHVGWW